jgi:hypothetical protein
MGYPCVSTSVTEQARLRIRDPLQEIAIYLDR